MNDIFPFEGKKRMERLKAYKFHVQPSLGLWGHDNAEGIVHTMQYY